MVTVSYKKSFSPNFNNININVEFLIIHYTAASLIKTLEIFKNPKSKSSSHLVIDTNGDIYEVVCCLEGTCFKAWHSGESYLKTPRKNWTDFNSFSIGVELVNKNGNLFEYTKQQYHSLNILLKKLKTLYKKLQNPNRILGHEHIAGHRGKIDPGHNFNWSLFFKNNYHVFNGVRKAMLPIEQKKIFLNKSINLCKKINTPKDEDWMKLNTQMENAQLKNR